MGRTNCSSKLMWNLLLHPILENVQKKKKWMEGTWVQGSLKPPSPASVFLWLHTGDYYKRFPWKFYLAVRIPFTSVLLSSIQSTCLSCFSSSVVFRHKGFILSQHQVLITWGNCYSKRTLLKNVLNTFHLLSVQINVLFLSRVRHFWF